MKWVEPKYSREKIKRAGQVLAFGEMTSSEFPEMIPVFFNWRAAHAFPMQIMLDLLRNHALKIDKRSVVVQRLKRTHSILSKLINEENMSLSRMEDIAGCRAVVENTDHVKRIHHSLKQSRTKNVLHRERDYIASPKESGYRGVHLIFRYKGKKAAFEKMAVELQIRSKIQHSWATALEVVATFTKQALKASTGEKAWLDFFKYASVEFAKLENCPIDPRYEDVDTFKKLDESIKSLGLAERLSAFKVAANALNNVKTDSAGYFILLLDLEERKIRYNSFEKKRQGEALEFYNNLEQKYKNDPNKDIVLVSAGSLKDLKRAYPNYFSDTSDFEKYIAQVYELNAVSSGEKSKQLPP